MYMMAFNVNEERKISAKVSKVIEEIVSMLNRTEDKLEFPSILAPFMANINGQK